MYDQEQDHCICYDALAMLMALAEHYPMPVLTYALSERIAHSVFFKRTLLLSEALSEVSIALLGRKRFVKDALPQTGRETPFGSPL